MQPETDRYRLFAEELDALKQRTFAGVGSDDVAYVVQLNRFSRAMEIVGRVLIQTSLDPRRSSSALARCGSISSFRRRRSVTAHCTVRGRACPAAKSLRPRRFAGTPLSTKNRGDTATTYATTGAPTSPQKIPTSTSAPPA